MSIIMQVEGGIGVMKIGFYFFFAIALFFYVRTVQTIWMLVTENKRLESGCALIASIGHLLGGCIASDTLRALFGARLSPCFCLQLLS
jgi:hypothetical protein